jgi:hypothetical protein
MAGERMGRWRSLPFKSKSRASSSLACQRYTSVDREREP